MSLATTLADVPYVHQKSSPWFQVVITFHTKVTFKRFWYHQTERKMLFLIM